MNARRPGKEENTRSQCPEYAICCQPFISSRVPFLKERTMSAHAVLLNQTWLPGAPGARDMFRATPVCLRLKLACGFIAGDPPTMRRGSGVPPLCLVVPAPAHPDLLALACARRPQPVGE